MNLQILAKALFFLLIPTPFVLSQELQSGMISATNGRISLRLEQTPLQLVLSTLQPYFESVAFFVSPEVEQKLVSVSLENASPEDVLRDLLQDCDYFIQYSAGKNRKSALRSVWVFGPEEAKEMKPAYPESVQRGQEIEASLRDSDPRIRLRAFRALLERPSAEAQQLALASIRNERDDDVRASMVEAIRSGESDLPSDFLLSLMSDSAEQIRMIALDALRGSPMLKDQATKALSDPNPHIRQRAQEILTEIEAESRQPQ